MTRALLEQRVLRDVDVVARAGLDVETFLAEAMTSIGRAVPHVAACVALVDPSTLLLTGTLKFGDLFGQDAHDHEWGLREYGDTEPTAFRELAHRAVPAVATRLEDPGSPRLNEFMRPRYGFTDELRVVMRDQGQVWGAAAMFRSGRDPAFTADQVALLAMLSETFSIGLRLGLLSQLGQAPQPPACGPAVVIVGRDDRIASMSTGAEQRLSELKVTEAQAAATGLVASLVGAARRYARGEEAHPPRTRVRTRTGMWFTLHASPMNAGDGRGTGDVVITIDEARPPEIVPLVVAAFDLTERERAVTGPSEIGVREGVRAQSARTHRAGLLRPVRPADGYRRRSDRMVRLHRRLTKSAKGHPVFMPTSKSAHSEAKDERFARLRQEIAATSPEHMDSYRAELREWETCDNDEGPER